MITDWKKNAIVRVMVLVTVLVVLPCTSFAAKPLTYSVINDLFKTEGYEVASVDEVKFDSFCSDSSSDAIIMISTIQSRAEGYSEIWLLRFGDKYGWSGNEWYLHKKLADADIVNFKVIDIGPRTRGIWVEEETSSMGSSITHQALWVFEGSCSAQIYMNTGYTESSLPVEGESVTESSAYKVVFKDLDRDGWMELIETMIYIGETEETVKTTYRLDKVFYRPVNE